MESPAADPSRNSPAYWLAFTTIAACVVVINHFTQPYNYADYDTYVLYLDSLVHFLPENWYYFEVFSNIYLLSLNWLVLSVEGAVILGHYLLGAMFLVFLLFSAPPGKTSWTALILVFVILGPLLAFVTLRATPAYFLTALAVTYASRRNVKAWLYLAGAALFHVSALLALVPIALLFFERRLGKVAVWMRSRRWMLLAIGGLVLLGTAFAAFADYASSALQSVPILSKYTAYTAVSNPNTSSNINHYIFFAFASGVTVLFVYFGGKETQDINIYILLSFAIYVILFFATSPVAAFRQTPFWLLPLILYFPWHRVGVVGEAAPIFLPLCAGLFYFQFLQVYY